jgi:glycosyltransferase involved in cell wall biosynthesis
MLFLSRFLGKKVILSLRGGGFLDFYRNSGLKWWIKVALDNASAIIVLSEYWEKELQEMTENKNVHVIGIHTYAAGDRTPRRVDGGKIRVIFVGRLEKNKGIYDLIEAIKILNESDGGKKLEFMIVGGDIDGVTRKYHADNVSFLGEVNHGEVMKLYASSHILVLPTYFEGCSYVIVEAMSFGLPVISTNIPSIYEFIKGGENGFLVRPGDYRAIAEHIIGLAENCKLRESIGENNVSLVMKFHAIEQFSAKMDGLFQSLIGNKK